MLFGRVQPSTVRLDLLLLSLGIGTGIGQPLGGIQLGGRSSQIGLELFTALGQGLPGIRSVGLVLQGLELPVQTVALILP